MANAVVLGASGGIGQPLSLLLKSNPLVKKVSITYKVASIETEEILVALALRYREHSWRGSRPQSHLLSGPGRWLPPTPRWAQKGPHWGGYRGHPCRYSP